MITEATQRSEKVEEASETVETDLTAGHPPEERSQRRRSRAHNDPRARRNTQRINSAEGEAQVVESTKATNTEESNL